MTATGNGAPPPEGLITRDTPVGYAYLSDRFIVEIWAESDEGEKKTVGWVEADVT